MVGHKKKQDNLIPVVDEGWWTSVLADENRFSSPPPARPAGNRLGVREEAKNPPVERQPAANWNQVKDLYMQDLIVDLIVTGHNRGGLLVEGEGIFGFVPVSHLVEITGRANSSIKPHDFDSYVGRTLHLKVIECVPEDGRVVFSERAAQSGPGTRAELFHTLQPGQTTRGIVTNITDFGVFVDLGGVEGLIHISEVSWSRVSHPAQFVKVGETIEVQVLDLAPERCRVALSLKRLRANPWTNATTDFPAGQVLPATITSVLSYGAFARLDAGVEGLIHASEIPQSEDSPVKEILTEGQRVNVRVLHVDPVHQRMGLSMKVEQPEDL